MCVACPLRGTYSIQNRADQKAEAAAERIWLARHAATHAAHVATEALEEEVREERVELVAERQQRAAKAAIHALANKKVRGVDAGAAVALAARPQNVKMALAALPPLARNARVNAVGVGAALERLRDSADDSGGGDVAAVAARLRREGVMRNRIAELQEEGRDGVRTPAGQPTVGRESAYTARQEVLHNELRQEGRGVSLFKGLEKVKAEMRGVRRDMDTMAGQQDGLVGTYLLFPSFFCFLALPNIPRSVKSCISRTFVFEFWRIPP